MAAVSGSVRAFVVGDCCQLTPGHSFTLTNHPNQNGDWLVVKAEHTIELEGRFWAGEEFNLKTGGHAEELELVEERHGTYLLNSQDLCLIKYLKELDDDIF